MVRLSCARYEVDIIGSLFVYPTPGVRDAHHPQFQMKKLRVREA